MDPDVLTAIIGVGGVVLTGILSYIGGRRASRDRAKQLEADLSGEIKVAEIGEAAQFRKDVLVELASVREDNRLMRAELTEHEARCENKIRTAVGHAEQECEESTNRKLRSQAAQIRAEYEPRLKELERRVGEISEPLEDV